MSLNLKSNFLSTLFAILFLWNCGEKNQIDFGAPIFSNNNFSNAQILLHYPEHYLANINGIILRVQNLENAKTVQLFSSATCSENSFVDEKAPTQNKVDFHVALTEDGTYNYYTKIVSNNGQTSSCIGPASYAFDSTPPKFIGSSSFGDSISLTTSESVNDIFIYDEFTCSNQVGQLIASAEGNDYVYAPTLPASGIYAFYAQTTDIAMNLSDCFGPLIYIYTNALPYLTIDPPTPLDINTGNVTYDVHYYNASTVNLTTGDITVNATGTVTYTVNVLNGTSTDPTIEVNITGGNGTIDSIDVGDGTAFDLIDIAFGESENTTVNIDNIPPSTSISGPSVTSIGAGNVDYDVTYVGANAINLTTGFVTVNTSGSVAYTVSVLNGTTATPTIRVSVTGGDGTIDSVILAGGAASDDAGNTDPGDSNATTVNVQNNLPAVDFTIASQASVAESGTMTITASIASPYFFDVTVPFSVHGSSTALDPDDFSISASPVIITAGNTTADITITIAPDNLDESNETVIVNMGVPTNGNLGTTTTHTATITDDDTAPGVTLSVDNANIDEDGDPFATFTATLDAVSGLDVTVNLSSSGTATGGGTDYTLSTTSIVILAGNTTGTATVTADQDTLDENNETVIIDIDSVTNGTETGTQQQTTTITDDDDAPAVTLTVDNANIDEDGDPFATFTATLSAASSFDVTVNLAYSGTATGVGVDYTASSSSIVILAGSTTGTVTVTADEDVFEESDETVIVDIDSVVNGTETGTQQQTTTIVDNEPPVVIIGAPSTTLENTGPIDYAVTYTAATIINLTPGDVTVTTTGTVAVNVTILNGTTANPTLRLDTITGDGTITEVAIAAGTSSDGGGFMDSGDNETTVVTIDNTAPTPVVSISATTPTPGDYNPPIIDVNVGADPGGLTSISLYRDDPTCLSTAVDTDGHPTNTTISLTSDTIITGTGMYDYYVEAFDAAGNSSGCTGLATYDMTAPDAVTNLDFSAKGCDYLTIGWLPPNGNGTTIINYQTQYKETSQPPSSYVFFDPDVSTDTQETITSLTVDTSYDFQMRTVTSNGAISPWSNTFTSETLPNNPFFCGANEFGAFNTGGATDSRLVVYEDNTTVTHYDSSDTPIMTYNLDAGDTQTINTTQFDYVLADKPVFIAGRLDTSSNADNRKANIVWSPKDWAGTRFIFNGSRNPNHLISVYAFENATVDVYNGGGIVDTANLTPGGNTTFELGNGSYEIISTGTIVTYVYSTGGSLGNLLVDPVPMMPLSTQIIGYPSNGAEVSSATDGNNISVYHSDDALDTAVVNEGVDTNVNPNGATTTLYRSESTHIIADDPIVARSQADSNGLAAAPYLPVTMMRKRYALNVDTEWVAFASLGADDIEIIDPFDGSVVGTLTLSQNDPSPPANSNAPFKTYITRASLLALINSGTTTEGVIFRSDTRFAAWYEPATDTDAADNDETILFGTDWVPLPDVNFTSASQASVGESGTLTITAQLSTTYTTNVTIPFSVNVLSTATNPDDYTITASPLVITPGNTTADITITITTDSDYEGDETINVNMGTPTNGNLGTVTTHTATITEDDPAPTVTFTSSGQTTPDESGSFVATLQLSSVSTLDVTIPYILSGSANNPQDYTIDASPAVITAGNLTTDVTITVVDNTLGEPLENVIVTMGTPVNAVQGATTVYTLAITDDDNVDIQTTMSGPGTVAEGNIIAYVITATNNGPEIATNLSINNSCPTGTTFSSAVPSGATVYVAPTWTIGTLVNSDSETLTLNCTVNVGQGGNVITNTIVSGNITVDQTETNTGNDGSSASTTVDNAADLSTTKSGNATQNEGSDIVYTIGLTNNGPAQAQNVILSDACPTGTTYNTGGTSATQGSYAAGVWSVGTLNNGQNETLTLACTVNAGQGGNIITNTITTGNLSMDQTESNTANDGSSASTTINNNTDLSTSKSAPATAIEGSDIVYSIGLTNNGPAQAQSVTLSDSCPTGTTYNAGGTSATQGSYAAGVWSVGTLNNGQNETLTLACTVNAGQLGNTITNTITTGNLSMDQTESNTANDGSSASTFIQDETDLSVSISAPTTGEVGYDVLYTITVDNLGPIQATNVALASPCPSGTTQNAGGTSATQGSYAAGVWSVGTMNNGATEILTLACTVDPGQEGTTVTYTITDTDLTQDQIDNTTGNESDSVDVFIANSTGAGGGSFSGNHFWAVMARNYDFGNGPCYIGNCIVTIQGDPGTNVVVDGTPTTIGVSGQFTQNLSENGNTAPYQGLSTTAPFEITSDGPINVFMGNALDQPTSAGTLLLPVHALGQTYYAFGYTNTVGAGNEVQAQIHVVATVDNTTININGNIQTIDEGESYSVSTQNGGFDITGQLITADQPVAVFVAETCLDTGPAACDMTMGQLYPADLMADTEFFFGGWSVQSEEMKCVATADSASVTVNGVFDNIYDQGDQINFTANTVLHIQSTQPLVCGVFALGSGTSDPAFTQIIGINHGMTRVEFPVPTPFLAGNILVMMQTADTGTFLYDGSTIGGWTTFPTDTSYSYRIITITSGPHSLVADSPFVPVMLVQPRTNAAYATSLGGLW